MTTIDNNDGLATERLVTLYRSATPAELAAGLGWYSQAHDTATTLAAEHGIPVSSVAAIIAALSQRSDWIRNLDRTRELLATGETYGLGRSVDKARRILSGEDPERVLSGPKVRAFWSNIADPLNSRAITIDRHAFDAVAGMVTDDRTRKGVLERKGGYESVADIYRAAARVLGVAPHVVQAVAWTVWRNRTGRFHYQRLEAA
jgi:hypothetical protein